MSEAACQVGPAVGRVRVEGVDLSGLEEQPRTAVRREQVGIVFQQPNLLPALSVIDQLMVTAHLSGLRGRRLRAQRDSALELLERVGMAEYANRDRKSTRLNSSHVAISYAVFCLKKKITDTHE